MKIDTLKDFIQSANINFLIGSGLSRDFLPVLGKIEEQLALVDKLPDDKRTGVTATLYREYFEKVIVPNFKQGDREDDFRQTLFNYTTFLNIWNSILHNRCSSLRSKQANIFSTNIDLMVELAAESTGVEFNDGFIGSVNPVFDEANFQKTIRKESVHFHNSTELPLFNLMKMHGSVNWKNCNGKIINDFNLKLINNTSKILEEFEEGAFPQYSDNNESIAKQIKGVYDYSKFSDAYSQFQIVNPTKRKFSETVLDMHFYELMRMFSNNLEKDNSILFVMGFSFADEHIRSIVKRALKTNPTLIVIIFSYTDETKQSYVSFLGDNISNLSIITPSSFNTANALKDDCKIERFDFKSINRVFDMILRLIPIQFGNGKK